MSVDRHMAMQDKDVSQLLPIIPHRVAPPSEMEIFGDKKPSPIEIGMLQMQVLWMLSKKAAHGYEIMDVLNRIKSTKVGHGTIYPALKSLRKHGYIKGEKSGEKIVYYITTSGKRMLQEASHDFTRTFFGIFQDAVCHKCVGHGDEKR